MAAIVQNQEVEQKQEATSLKKGEKWGDSEDTDGTAASAMSSLNVGTADPVLPPFTLELQQEVEKLPPDQWVSRRENFTVNGSPPSDSLLKLSWEVRLVLEL